MKNYRLGEFEEIVLLIVGILNDNAYGVTIIREIKKQLDRDVSVGALQATLRRLEKKGFLNSRHGESEASRGGRPKLFFTITADGQKAVTYTKESRVKLWSLMPEMNLNFKIS